MIKAQDVGQETYNKIEGSIWRNVQRIMTWGWYATGQAISVAPSEHQMIEYGRDWALARYFQDGGRWQDAVEEATKAVYRYAYDDIKPYIRYDKQGKNRIKVRTMIYDMSETGLINGANTESTRFTTFEQGQQIYQELDFDNIAFRSLINSLDLNPLQKQIVWLKANGFSQADTARYLDYSRQYIQALWRQSVPVLEEYYGKIL